VADMPPSVPPDDALSVPEPGEEEAPQGWTWTLFVGAKETAVELWRDGELRITVPLTNDQAELLMGHPVSLVGALRDDGLIADDGPPDAGTA
jgi:hypothetical protein